MIKFNQKLHTENEVKNIHDLVEETFSNESKLIDVSFFYKNVDEEKIKKVEPQRHTWIRKNI